MKSEAAAQKKKRAFSDRELSAFSQQMAMLIQAGLPIREGLSLLAEENDDDSALYSAMYAGMEGGATFSEVLAAAGVFPGYYLRMVEAGERTGQLDRVTGSLGDYYRRKDEISRSIRSAVAYPLLMVFLMTVVGVVIIWKVLPVFAQVFRQLGSEPDGLARGFLRMGDWMGQYAYIVVGIILVIVVVVLVLRVLPGVRRVLQKWWDKLFRGLSSNISMERFSSTLSMGISSGMDMDEALELAARLTADKEVDEKVELCRKQLEEGKSLSGAMTGSGLFTGLNARLLEVGNRTGALDEALGKIAEQYQRDIEERLEIVISRIEPTLVGILCCVVGIILLSVMLPLMGILSSI
ncbi:MAG: type II secretion system F family protein [Oscillospiraceae bacterium]